MESLRPKLRISADCKQILNLRSRYLCSFQLVLGENVEILHQIQTMLLLYQIIPRGRDYQTTIDRCRLDPRGAAQALNNYWGNIARIHSRPPFLSC